TFALGETVSISGFGVLSDAKGKGEPAIGVSNPLAVSMLKTEIEAGTTVAGGGTPWLRTKRNVPAEFTPRLTGLAQTALLAHTGVGGKAVPIGVKTPFTWSTEKPETVPAVTLAAYMNVLAGVSVSAAGRGLVGKDDRGSGASSPVVLCPSAWMLFAPWPTT